MRINACGTGRGAGKMPSHFNPAIIAAVLLGFVFVAIGCAAGTDKPNPVLPVLKLVSGQVSVMAEIAKTEEQRNRGLMFRKSLADGKGMLFVFDGDLRPAFWMKNTQIPLSLAYMTSDGTITQILDLVPFSTEARPSERLVRYALEVPQGWFGRVGLKPGDVIAIPALN